MLEQEFREKVKNLFQDFEKFKEYDNSLIPDYKLNDEIFLTIIESGIYYTIGNHTKPDLIYKSPIYDDFETFYDELIIFKEFILPKYL